MKKKIHACIKSANLKCLLLLISAISVQCTYSQARLIINNASFININDGSFLVIDNSANNAITRIGTAGWIISEGTIGNNRVKWKIGPTAATFTVPFGFGTTHDLPLTITTTDAVGSGHIIFSTFRSGVNTINLPTAGPVVPQTMLPTSYNHGSNDNNSAFGVDRFYQIDATDPAFTTNPTLSDIIFSYTTAEHDASITANTITEANLQAQYWDNTLADWSATPLGIVTPASNNVTVSSHSATLLTRSKWWSLVDNSNPLPVSLLSFTGECLDKTVEVKWITASELNNDFFTIERSTDAMNWQTISTVTGAGNSNSITHYSVIDINKNFHTSYYRLKQTDFDGTSTSSSIITVRNCAKNLSHLNTNAFFNTTQQNVQVIIDSDISSTFSIAIYNPVGSLIAFKDVVSFAGKNQIVFKGLNLSDGIYLVTIKNSEAFFTHKIINKS